MRAHGFTLLELLTAMGLAMVVYALVAYTTLQLNRTARAAGAAATERARMIRATEQLRWQLRTLFAKGTDPQPGASPSPVVPTGSSARYGALGNLGVYGKRTTDEGREILLFRTARLERGPGATEVGYRILADEETGEPYLAYRQYPFVDPVGLHPPEEDPDAPWRVLSRDLVAMKLEFSGDGEIWQREWESAEVPRWIRVTLTSARGAEFEMVVVPGMEAPRW